MSREKIRIESTQVDGQDETPLAETGEGEVNVPVKETPKQEPKVSEKKPASTIVTWQFKKRLYHVITNALDKLAEKTRSGAFRKRVIRARNWRLDLDLSKPEDAADHKYLLEHKDVNHDYYLLADKGKTDKVSEEGATLKSLMEMSIPQLMGCITDDELNEVGLMPNNIDKYQLVMAIMRKKKLV